MPASSLQAEERLYELAPTNLENYRVRRYRGDGANVSLGALAEGDRQRIHRLYTLLLQLREELLQSRAGAGVEGLAVFLRHHGQDELLQLAQEMGYESCAGNPSAELARAIHDLRGGGLTPLVGLLQLAQRRGLTETTVNSAFHLTRDHLKIMRNVLPDLDEARHSADLLRRTHGTSLIVDKWQNAIWPEEGRQTRIVVDCAREMTISTCCLESGALDRIL